MANKEHTDTERMEKIVSLCKRRGFIFQAAELYGGLNGCWDYGPLGAELKRNLKDYWWRKHVQERDDILGMDGSILTHQAVLTSSGHIGGFSDPMCDDLVTRERFRADQIEPKSGYVFQFIGSLPHDLFFELSEKTNEVPPEYFSENIRLIFRKTANAEEIADSLFEKLNADYPSENFNEDEISEIKNFVISSLQTTVQLDLFKKWSYVMRPLKVLMPSNSLKSAKKATNIASEFYAEVASKQNSPIHTGEPEWIEESTKFNPLTGVELTEPKEFNLMFRTKMGAASDEDDPNAAAYLRPETAQSIFTQYKNILDSNRVKLPFGIAQIGKAFRNEVNPRNYIFRSREFEQMEIEYFCRPEDGMRLTDEWLETRLKFYEAIGIPREKLHVIDIPDGERAFYSAKTYDIEYDFPFGQQELEGVAYRTNYDLRVHQEGSGKTLEYFDEETKERFLPHVVEPSAGCDRTLLALICEAYDEEDLTKEGGKKDVRTVLRFKPQVAPVKVAVLPLLKNKSELVAKAKEVKNLLQPFMNVAYDEAAAIGRRYRRQDEAGTPFCIAIDFQTIGEKDENGNDLSDSVTIRHRDSMEQERLPISEVLPWLLERIR